MVFKEKKTLSQVTLNKIYLSKQDSRTEQAGLTKDDSECPTPPHLQDVFTARVQEMSAEAASSASVSICLMRFCLGRSQAFTVWKFSICTGLRLSYLVTTASFIWIIVQLHIKIKNCLLCTQAAMDSTLSAKHGNMAIPK